MHRWLPSIDFPAYTFVPGQTPRHSEQPSHDNLPALSEQNWRSHPAYLQGLDLFNAGFYWEAHEVWEAAWHASGRTGDVCDLLKLLIKLAAAGVKIRELNPAGFARHAQRCQALIAQLSQAHAVFLGIRLPELATRLIARVACAAEIFSDPDSHAPPGNDFQSWIMLPMESPVAE